MVTTENSLQQQICIIQQVVQSRCCFGYEKEQILEGSDMLFGFRLIEYHSFVCLNKFW